MTNDKADITENLKVEKDSFYELLMTLKHKYGTDSDSKLSDFTVVSMPTQEYW